MIIFEKMYDAANAMDTIKTLQVTAPNKPIGKYLRGAMLPHYPMPAIIYDVYHQVDNNSSTEIWERTGTKNYINRRVYSYYSYYGVEIC